MQKEQRTFTREFKVEAVQLVQSSNKTQAQIARDLGIADSTLYHWCQQLSEHGVQAFPGSGHQTPQEEEIRQLKRENEVRIASPEIFLCTLGKTDAPSIFCACFAMTHPHLDSFFQKNRMG